MQISFKPMLQPQHTRTQKKTVRDPHPPSHRLLASFSDARDLGRWKVFSDAAHGGTTEASLTPSGLFPGTAEFRGALAGPGAAGRARSGFAGMTVQLGGGSEEDEAESEAEDARERLSARAAGDGGEAGGADKRVAAPAAPASPVKQAGAQGGGGGAVQDAASFAKSMTSKLFAAVLGKPGDAA